ncbi:hypothetical protein [Cellulosimicrobium cellulans]|uniref:hypothetical protein n=1 Tax=Cellulosimicrobium cellulans TaxID=1710 RepID=UPI00130E3F9E|nr:hypothetical protein [Cellulosimicrobium cellulans]
MSDEQLGWTDEDDARFAFEALPDWHPAVFVDVFRATLGLEDREGRTAFLTQALVTPESVPQWGTFARATALFGSGLRMSLTALYALDAPDVAYVRLVETAAHQSPSVVDVPATAHVTLVWRRDIAIVPRTGWRVHHVGEPIAPNFVPRSAPGVDPHSLR